MEFKRILVSVNGAKSDADVIWLACDLAKSAKGKVHATYVIQLDRTLPLDAEVKSEVDKGELVLDAAEHYGEEYGCAVTTDLLQARSVGSALVNEAIERNIDLIIIAGDPKSHLSEYTTTDVEPYVLANAPCHVIFMHKPVWEKQKSTG